MVNVKSYFLCEMHPIRKIILLLFLSLGVRDYIHVVDLAKGHIAALKKLKDNCGCKVQYTDCLNYLNTLLPE